MSIYCSKCGAEVPEDVNFCPKCGAVIAKIIEESKTANKTPPIPSLEQAKRVKDETVSQVRPWVRHWARCVDLTLFGVTLGIIIVITVPFYYSLLLKIPEIFLGMLMIFIWIFVESSLLSTWGMTPGKWLLRTTLRNSEGQKLTFSGALKRSFSVWLKGLGIGFPIVTVITMIVAYGTLTREGVTTWDREGGFVVSHKKIGALRVIVVILFFFGIILLNVLGKTAEKSGW